MVDGAGIEPASLRERASAVFQPLALTVRNIRNNPVVYADRIEVQPSGIPPCPDA